MNQTRGTLWAFDFDGTLSPLVPSRSRARLDSDCEDLLQALAHDPRYVVAIVTTRSLEDLESRIPIEDVFLAGSSGLEWKLPNNQYLTPTPRARERADRERERVRSALDCICRIHGVELEDKFWSIAVHYRNVHRENHAEIVRELEYLRVSLGLSLRFGPEVAEIQLIEEVDKSTAVRALVRLNERKFHNPQLVYAGDDQNDVTAMRWVLERQGTVYVVGDRISVKGASVVLNPSDLALTISRRLNPEIEYRPSRWERSS